MCALGACEQILMHPPIGSTVSFPVIIGAVPIIRCPRGNAAEMVAVVRDPLLCFFFFKFLFKKTKTPLFTPAQ